MLPIDQIGRERLRNVARRTPLFVAATVWLLAVVAIAHAQTIRVPGGAGRKWVDTGIDLKPDTLVSLYAEGRVNYGAGVGAVGPAGTTTPPAAQGFPAENALPLRARGARHWQPDEL